ncbi:MAG: hypothetical protein K0S32_4189 [Bacteroidetes bacterium]|jgi:hypothetical protein|nr:hypothetical protein [Bacteroidota bacterium]
MEETLAKYNISLDDVVWFDCEAFEEGDTYESTFDDLVKITKGKFMPEAISWRSGFSEEPKWYIVEAAFYVNDKKQIIKMSSEEWFDIDLITELNKVIEQHLSIEERFCPVVTRDQSMIIAFVNKEIYNRLLADGMVEQEYVIGKPENWKEMKIVDQRYP